MTATLSLLNCRRDCFFKDRRKFRLPRQRQLTRLLMVVFDQACPVIEFGGRVHLPSAARRFISSAIGEPPSFCGTVPSDVRGFMPCA